MLKPESNQAVENFFSAVDTEFNQFLHDRKPEDYQAAAQLILESQAQGGRIHVTGIGKCSHVATYVASLLSSTGNPAYYLHGTEAVHGSCGQLVAGDVVIAISNSGETGELEVHGPCREEQRLQNRGCLRQSQQLAGQEHRRLPLCRCARRGRPPEPGSPEFRSGGNADSPGPVRGPAGREGLGSHPLCPLPSRRSPGPAPGRREKVR